MDAKNYAQVDDSTMLLICGLALISLLVLRAVCYYRLAFSCWLLIY